MLRCLGLGWLVGKPHTLHLLRGAPSLPQLPETSVFTRISEDLTHTIPLTIFNSNFINQLDQNPNLQICISLDPQSM